MFGLEPSLAAKKALNIFKENKYSKIVELGAGLGRDTIYFGKNSINCFLLKRKEFFLLNNFDVNQTSQAYLRNQSPNAEIAGLKYFYPIYLEGSGTFLK